MDNERTIAYLKQLETEVRAIKKQAMHLTWWMRGGITYDVSLDLSREEQNIITEIAKENMETTKKSKMPFF